MRRRRGTTLIEVLITMSVFALLMIAMFAVQRVGTDGWRDVNAKSDVSNDMHRFEADITTDLSRAFASSVHVYTPSTDFHWAVWFQTPMNDPADVGANGVPTATLGDPLTLVTDSTGTPVPQRWVLYYVTRMDPNEHIAYFGPPCASYGSGAGPDTTCPHKWIVKKDIAAIGAGGPITLDNISILPYMVDVPDANSTQSSEMGLANEVNNPAYCGGTVARAHVIMRNVVSFELARLALNNNPGQPPVSSPSGPIILFDVKAFKLLDAQKAVAFGNTPMVTVNKDANDDVLVSPVIDSLNTTQMQTSALVTGQYRQFTVQVDNRVIPQN